VLTLTDGARSGLHSPLTLPNQWNNKDGSETRNKRLHVLNMDCRSPPFTARTIGDLDSVYDHAVGYTCESGEGEGLVTGA